ncbi:uncharacterized protein B0H18DRAFT_1026553 [Fomitopsis serialis]|uniref:uncharacterized protein n=1 Tax=Fomitopsis serialis TaxID=139415 RepID=UPI00200797E1|nr:uncharacterized protein B0H18DRAFT_1026553 [Neoantrodia serialis]KAH9919868.1 hypothetical protein B0H18DRAFT_1026553 [Neoantrodia serialis]
MRFSAVVAVALLAATGPAVALPIGTEFGIAARALQNRRSADMVESFYARDEDDMLLSRREPVNLNRLRIGVVANRYKRSPFVVFSKAAANIPACHTGFAFCGRSIEDELD